METFFFRQRRIYSNLFFLRLRFRFGCELNGREARAGVQSQRSFFFHFLYLCCAFTENVTLSQSPSHIRYIRTSGLGRTLRALPQALHARFLFHPD